MNQLEKILTWGIALFIFLLPWQARYLFTTTPGTELLLSFYHISVIDLFFLVLLLPWTFWLISKRKKLSSRISSLEKKHLILAFTFVAYTAISVQFAESVEIASFKWDRIVQAVLLFFMVLTLRVPMRVLFLSLMGGGLVQSLVAIQQFFTQSISANTWLGIAQQLPEQLGSSVIAYQGGRWLRAYGTLSHPNILGGYLVIGLLIASGWYLDIYAKISAYHKKFNEVDKQIKKSFAVQVFGSFLGFGLLFTGLLMTFSRAAWLGFILGYAIVFFAFLFQVSGKLKGYIIIAAMKQIMFASLILLMLSISYAPFWTSRAFGGSAFTEQSVSQREVYLEQAKNVISEKWLIGTGVGDYLFEAAQRFSYTDAYAIQPVHNTWLFLWAELGLVGMSFFIAWGYVIILLLKKTIQKLQTANDAITFSLFVGVGILFYFDHFWWSNPFGLWIFSLILILLSQSFTQQKTS